MELKSCRIHKGKLVRMFKGACAGKNEIFCSTPDCINNCVEDSKCGLPLVNVAGGNCNDYVSKAEHPSAPIASRRVSIKRTAEDTKDEKDITIEVPESNAKDVKSPADKPKETIEESVKEESKDIGKIKSQVWTDTLKKTVEEAVDIDEASEQWFKNMKEEIGNQLSDEKISESDYDSLLSELEDLKENGELSESIKKEILEQAGDVSTDEEENSKEEEEKKEEEPKKEGPKKEKKSKEDLPELPGLDLENI
jgi:hypothetical protein